MDVETVIRYFVVHNFVCNDDSYTGTIIHNYYLYEEDGVMEMIPWDYNLAFGGFGGDLTAEVSFPIDTPVSGEISERPMIAWIFADEEYTELYHQIYAELIEKWFDSDYFEQLFDNVVALISPYVKKDPTAFCSYEEFIKGSQTLREFCLLRADSVLGQLKGTIPSTEDGQNQDGSALLDASALDASAMGGQSMGGQGGQPMGGNRGNMQAPGDVGSADEHENNPAAQPSAPPDNRGTENDVNNTSSETTEPQQPGNAVPGGQTPSVSPYQWVWAAVSIGILLAALIGTKLYKRW